MTHLSDRFVVDAKPSVVHKQDEQNRKLDVHFSKHQKDIEGRVEVHDSKPINPMADLLKGVRL